MDTSYRTDDRFYCAARISRAEGEPGGCGAGRSDVGGRGPFARERANERWKGGHTVGGPGAMVRGAAGGAQTAAADAAKAADTTIYGWVSLTFLIRL